MNSNCKIKLADFLSKFFNNLSLSSFFYESESVLLTCGLELFMELMQDSDGNSDRNFDGNSDFEW